MSPSINTKYIQPFDSKSDGKGNFTVNYSTTSMRQTCIFACIYFNSTERDNLAVYIFYSLWYTLTHGNVYIFIKATICCVYISINIIRSEPLLVMLHICAKKVSLPHCIKRKKTAQVKKNTTYIKKKKKVEQVCDLCNARISNKAHTAKAGHTIEAHTHWHVLFWIFHIVVGKSIK